MSIRQMQEVITLLALCQDVLRDVMLEDKEDDPTLMAIYCHALLELGVLLQDTVVSIATYCSPYLDFGVGCDDAE